MTSFIIAFTVSVAGLKGKAGKWNRNLPLYKLIGGGGWEGCGRERPGRESSPSGLEERDKKGMEDFSLHLFTKYGVRQADSWLSSRGAIERQVDMIMIIQITDSFLIEIIELKCIGGQNIQHRERIVSSCKSKVCAT